MRVYLNTKKSDVYLNENYEQVREEMPMGVGKIDYCFTIMKVFMQRGYKKEYFLKKEKYESLAAIQQSCTNTGMNNSRFQKYKSVLYKMDDQSEIVFLDNYRSRKIH